MATRSVLQLMAAALALGAVAPACTACMTSNTALTEELRSLRAGMVITPASGAAYNDSLGGASTSGLPNDVGITPGIIVRPEGQADMHLCWSTLLLLSWRVGCVRYACRRADVDLGAACRRNAGGGRCPLRRRPRLATVRTRRRTLARALVSDYLPKTTCVTCCGSMA